MKYNELQAETNKDRKRVGRGISAGQGKTAGRGTKGQGARTGKKHGHMFMGGQGSIVRRTPKARGFKSIRVPAQALYLDQLADIKGTVITNETLYDAGLVATPYHAVKIIAARKEGVYTGKATVKVQGASASVVVAITKAGGVFEAVAVPNQPATNTERAAKKADKAQKAEKKSS